MYEYWMYLMFSFLKKILFVYISCVNKIILPVCSWAQRLVTLARTIGWRSQILLYSFLSFPKPAQLYSSKLGPILNEDDQKLRWPKMNIRDRQPMVRASVTERWAQLKSGNMIWFTYDLYMYTNIICLRNENIEYIQYSYISF